MNNKINIGPGIKSVLVLFLLMFALSFQAMAQLESITGSASTMGSTLDKVTVDVKRGNEVVR